MHTACTTIQFHFAHLHTAARARELCAQDGLNKRWVQGRRLYVYACYCIADEESTNQKFIFIFLLYVIHG